MGKIKNSILLVSLCLLIGLGFVYWSQVTVPVESIEIEQVEGTFFLGQVYPSGHVYLRSFDENQKQWPNELTFIGLTKSDHEVSQKNRRALFDKTLASQYPEVDGTVQHPYLPNQEEMEDEHRGCGMEEKKANPDFIYLDPKADPTDFFETVFDHCEPLEKVALYKTKGDQKFSYFILAFPTSLGEASLTRLSEKKRELDEEERKQVQEQKQNLKQKIESQGYECTTNPAFIDNAKEHFLVSFANSARRTKLSWYFDPGCAGHLSNIYILDLINGESRKSATLSTYQGGI